VCAGRRRARGSRRAAGRAAGRPTAAGAARQAPAVSRRLRAACPPPRSAPFPSVHHAEAEANSGTLMAPSPSLDSGRPEKPRRRHRVPPPGAARGHHRRVAPAVCRRPRSPGARVPGWRRGRSWMAAVGRRAEAVSGGRRRAGRRVPGHSAGARLGRRCARVDQAAAAPAHASWAPDDSSTHGGMGAGAGSASGGSRCRHRGQARAWGATCGIAWGFPSGRASEAGAIWSKIATKYLTPGTLTVAG